MRSRTVVGATIGIVVLGLLVAAALIGSRRSVTNYDDGTPEATVQAYFDALIDDRPADAYDLFSERVSDECRDPVMDIYARPPSRVALDRVTVEDSGKVEGAEATVVVRITQVWGNDPFSGGEDTFTERLDLVVENGAWVFDRVPWPYPCPPEFFEEDRLDEERLDEEQE